MTDNDLYESAQLLSADTLNLLGSKTIEQDRIRLLQQIGQGNFGKVFKGNEVLDIFGCIYDKKSVSQKFAKTYLTQTDTILKK